MKNPFLRYLSQNHFLATLLIAGVIWFLVEIKSILVILFIAFIIAAAISPVSDFLRRKKSPNIIAVILPFISMLSILILVFLALIPFFIDQIQSLIVSFPHYLDRASRLIGVELNVGELRSAFTSDVNLLSKNALTLTTNVFGGMFSILSVLVISFYLLIDRRRIRESILSLFPKSNQGKTENTLNQIESKLGAWVRGQIVLSFAVGAFTWILLTIISLPFALPLAVLAGMLEIVPTIGPILSAVPAVIVALNISPTIALLVVGAYILTQMLENNILVPKIMEKAVGLNPIIVITGVMIGANFLGVLGALLSVPFISVLTILYKTFSDEER